LLFNLVLTLNAFQHDGQIFQQIHGTSMGTPVAPTYANIFMGWLEQKILAGFRIKPLVFLRYLDDLFIIWQHGNTLLDTFVGFMNSFHPTINFTCARSESSVAFLDVLVSLEKGKLFTTLYRKPTDKHQYLDYTSHHPRHCKDGIPNSQIVRLRRLCMDDQDYNDKVDSLLGTLSNRHYPAQILQQAKHKSQHLDRATSLQPRNTEKHSNPAKFITSFSTRLQSCNSILRKHYYLLRTDPTLKKLFSVPPSVIFRRNVNFQNLLMKPKRPLASFGCEPCKDKRCMTCSYIEEAASIESAASDFSMKIRGKFNCKSANVVYCIDCKLCNKQYIGETKQEFHKRMNQHRVDITHKKDAAIADHFNLSGHSVGDIKVRIIQGGFRTDRDRKYRESYLIFKFKSLLPNGLNRSSGSLLSVQCIPHK
jgi:hypothetical protein